MDMNEKILKHKTRTELYRIIDEMQSERDAVRKDIFRFQERILELENELDWCQHNWPG